jgi:hypothetical protein
MKLQILGVTASVALMVACGGRLDAQPVQPTVKCTAVMRGTTAATAPGSATLLFSGHTLKYTVTVTDLSGPATMVEIHVGQWGRSGPPVLTFAINKVDSGTLAEGTIDLSKHVSPGVSGDSLRVLLNNGNAYINVHTTAHPGGELRGQVVRE